VRGVLTEVNPILYTALLLQNNYREMMGRYKFGCMGSSQRSVPFCTLHCYCRITTGRWWHVTSSCWRTSRVQ